MSGGGLGFCLPLRGWNARQVIELGEEAAAIGYRSIWVSELASYDAVAVSTALLHALPRAHVGTAIVPFASRSGALLAMSAATMGAVGGSRAILGLGVSTPLVVEQWHRRPFNPPLRQAVEGLDAIESALATGRPGPGDFRIDAEGERPRLYLAALGPKMLDLARRRASGVLLNLLPFFAMDQVVAGHCGEAGSGFEVCMPVRTCVADDAGVQSRARERFARELASYIRVDVYANAWRRLGRGDVVDRVSAAADLPDAARRLGPDVIDETAVIGDAHACAAAFAKIRGGGGSPLVVPIASPGDGEEVRRVMTAAASLQRRQGPPRPE